jgi:hypothetical protein
MAGWQDGRMEEWQNGRMVEWKEGGMAEWRNGRMVFYYIPNLPCYIYGTRRRCQQRRQQHRCFLNHLDVLMYQVPVPTLFG